MKRRHRRATGLTIIEVLVAIAMLGIISASVVALLPTIVDLNRDANAEQEVTAASKLFFEGLAGVEATSVGVDDSPYAAGETITGTTVAVPEGCTARVTQLDANRVSIALDCANSELQVLELGASP